MKLARLIVLSCCASLFLGCGSLRRGFEGTNLVSTGKPELLVEAAMPVLALGRISPYLYTARGYQFPETYVVVYGVDVKTPMAISTLSIAPEGWDWDPLSFSPADSPITSEEFFGGATFDGSIQVVSGSKDAFTSLIASEKEREAVYWLAQRYAHRAFFNKAKIILEYREPLPKTFEGSSTLPMDSPEIQAFQKRARQAFKVSFEYSGTNNPLSPYLQGVDAKFLGRYLGSMSVAEPIFIDK